jgi:hypothetical protein
VIINSKTGEITYQDSNVPDWSSACRYCGSMHGHLQSCIISKCKGVKDMDEHKARELLGKGIQEDGSLYNLSKYMCWNKGEEVAVLDGEFTADELEAIAYWMRDKKR